MKNSSLLNIISKTRESVTIFEELMPYWLKGLVMVCLTDENKKITEVKLNKNTGYVFQELSKRFLKAVEWDKEFQELQMEIDFNRIVGTKADLLEYKDVLFSRLDPVITYFEKQKSFPMNNGFMYEPAEMDAKEKRAFRKTFLDRWASKVKKQVEDKGIYDVREVAFFVWHSLNSWKAKINEQYKASKKISSINEGEDVGSSQPVSVDIKSLSARLVYLFELQIIQNLQTHYPGIDNKELASILSGIFGKSENPETIRKTLSYIGTGTPKDPINSKSINLVKTELAKLGLDLKTLPERTREVKKS